MAIFEKGDVLQWYQDRSSDPGWEVIDTRRSEGGLPEVLLRCEKYDTTQWYPVGKLEDKYFVKGKEQDYWDEEVPEL